MDNSFLLDDDALILQKLHDDELYYIFLYLDLFDLYHLEEVSLRFAAVAWQVYRTYKKLDYNDLHTDTRCPTEFGAEEIALRVGQNIEHLAIDVFHPFHTTNYVIPDFLFTHFPKLQSISISSYNFDKMNKELSEKMKMLLKRVKCVELEPDGLSERNFMHWLKHSQIESLTVKRGFFKGKFLTKLSNMRELDLSGVTVLDYRVFSMCFKKFCKYNSNLQSLNLFYCKWIDTKCLMSIAELQNLEVLKVTDDFDVDDPEDYLVLTKLTKLKHFTMYAFIDDYMLNTLIMLTEGISKRNKLESLTIESLTMTFSFDLFMDDRTTMQSLVKNLTQVKELNLKTFAMWHDDDLMNLPCHKILERVTIENSGVSADGVVELIARCPLLKYLKLAACFFTKWDDFIKRILPFLKDRNHMLVIEVEEYEKKHLYDDYVECPPELFDIYKGVNSSKLQMISLD